MAMALTSDALGTGGAPDTVEWLAPLMNIAPVRKGISPKFPIAMTSPWQGWGEVTFEDAFGAMNAVRKMNGTNMLGSTLSIMLDPMDNTTIIVQGVPAGAVWQELKDHFAMVGAIEASGSIPGPFRASAAGASSCAQLLESSQVDWEEALPDTWSPVTEPMPSDDTPDRAGFSINGPMLGLVSAEPGRGAIDGWTQSAMESLQSRKRKILPQPLPPRPPPTTTTRSWACFCRGAQLPLPAGTTGLISKARPSRREELKDHSRRSSCSKGLEALDICFLEAMAAAEAMPR